MIVVHPVVWMDKYIRIFDRNKEFMVHHIQTILANHSLPVLEIDKRGKRAWRTKDILEDQKLGGPKNLLAEEAWGTKQLGGDTKLKNKTR